MNFEEIIEKYKNKQISKNTLTIVSYIHKYDIIFDFKGNVVQYKKLSDILSV